MRLPLALAALLLAAPLASAQIAPEAPVSDDAIVLIAVPTQSIPADVLGDLPAIPEGAELVTGSDAPSLSYDLPAETLAAMASPKDETVGLLIGILIAGGGQIYAGETTKGLTILGVSVGSLVAGGILSGITGSSVPSYLGLVGYLGAWIYGISDAQAAVRRYNSANGFALVPSPVEAGGDVGFGLAMRARF